MQITSPQRLLLPTLVAGVLMVGYLVLRPYGDAGSEAEVAGAFASTAWVVSHVLGLLAIAAIGLLTLRLAEVCDGAPARLARRSGLLGVVLVLPYYGAETFGLHALGHWAAVDPAVLALTEEIRQQPVAITMFGIGLVLLAVAGIAIGITWSRAGSGLLSGGAWPLAVAIAALAPQFYLPPAGRVAFGLVFGLAAAIFAAAILSARRAIQAPAR